MGRRNVNGIEALTVVGRDMVGKE